MTEPSGLGAADDDNNNKAKRVYFQLSESSRAVGIAEMYRFQNSIFVEISLPEYLKNAVKFFLDITQGKLDNTPKELGKKATETLTPYRVPPAEISMIRVSLAQEIVANYQILVDLSSAGNKKVKKSGEDIWGKDKTDVDFSSLDHDQILKLRYTRHADYANKVTKTKLPRYDSVFAKLNNNSLQSLTEDERFKAYEGFDRLCFKDMIHILYEAVVFRSPKSADKKREEPAVDELTEKIASYTADQDKAKENKDIFLEDNDRYTTKFVYYDQESDSFKEEDYILLNDRVIFPTPASSAASIPYEFYNIEHLNMFYQHKVKGTQTTISSLFEENLSIFKHFNKQSPAVTIAWSAAPVVSYFQDKYPVIPYFAGIGIPGSGKSTKAETELLLCYRGMKMTNPNAAQATRVFGNVEPGQYTFIADEADKIGKDSDFMPMIKDGYMYTARFQKVNLNSMLIEWFYPYGMKFMFAEKLPSEWTSAGFYDRTFIEKTQKHTQKSTDPNIKDVATMIPPTKADQAIKLKILNLRKKCLLYRMAHFNDPLPVLDVNVGGRDKELVYPFIQLFNNTKYEDTITWAMQTLLDGMNNVKRNTLSMDLCIRISKFLIKNSCV